MPRSGANNSVLEYLSKPKDVVDRNGNQLFELIETNTCNEFGQALEEERPVTKSRLDTIKNYSLIVMLAVTSAFLTDIDDKVIDTLSNDSSAVEKKNVNPNKQVVQPKKSEESAVALADCELDNSCNPVAPTTPPPTAKQKSNNNSDKKDEKVKPESKKKDRNSANKNQTIGRVVCDASSVNIPAKGFDSTSEAIISKSPKLQKDSISWTAIETLVEFVYADSANKNLPKPTKVQPDDIYRKVPTNCEVRKG